MTLLKKLFTTEGGLRKPINAQTHGLIDYCQTTFFLGFALICLKSNRKAAATAAGVGALVLTEALLTDYPAGKKKLIPFAVHGGIDAGLAVLSPLLPWLFGFSNTKAATVFQINGVVEGAAVALTDFDSQHARAAESH